MRNAAYRVVRDLHDVLHSISMSDDWAHLDRYSFLISGRCADDDGFAATYNRDSNVTDRKTPVRLLRTDLSRTDILAS
jgi:hypothetical protein